MSATMKALSERTFALLKIPTASPAHGQPVHVDIETETTELLLAFWLSIDKKMKERYSKMWGIFKNNVKTALERTHTGRLTEFVSNLAKNLDIDELGEYREQRESVMGIVRMGFDTQILNKLRTELDWCIMLTQEARDKRFESIKQKKGNNND